MKRGFSVFFLALCFFIPSGPAYAQTSWVDQLSSGYQSGRSNAPYGTYTSVMADNTRSLQADVLQLENKVYGLGSLFAEDHDAAKNEKLAEVLYSLEIENLKLYNRIANLKDLSDFERSSLSYTSLRTYKLIRSHQERLFEDMVRFIDAKFPGLNGIQSRHEIEGQRDSLYEANYRTDKSLTANDRQQFYQQRVQDFIRQGGQLSEMKIWQGKASVADLKSYTRFEYVLRKNNQLWLTEGSAGHVLLAEGGSVKSAGQLIILKNNLAQISLIIASNASGNYKPDLYSAELLAKRLARETGTPLEKVIVTKGEPVSIQTIKIYLKGLGKDKDEIKNLLSPLEKMTSTLSFPMLKSSCSRLYR